MMRSLWTAASGMKAQQLNIDVISNNLANVTTTGYKKSRMEFKDLFYETLEKSRGSEESQNPRPTSLQIGHGVRAAATVKDFTIGNIEQTGDVFNFALEGDGFFAVKSFGATSNDDDVNSYVYTKDGSFKVSADAEGLKYLTTAQGYVIMNENNEPILLSGENGEIDTSKITVDQNGAFSYIDSTSQKVELNQRLKVVQFYNPNGLESIGDNLYKRTAASGKEVSEEEVPSYKKSKVLQGYLERSNVQIVEEMVNMIVAQRAYEINSKSIQASDEMMQQANQLRR
ncbi:MAG TPA: flagellar basal-body rod protein FlgG [Clostridiales bacterium]|nr:MAG: flagellar basal-body rod protein FlgG [Clostridiales bacterium GWD2_32_59]HAN10381.1 flagellar basal-body rod protein FlgG [Clostridiales bacterium]